MAKPMTPYEFVRSRYLFPYEAYLFQQEGVNELAPLPKTACLDDPGLGKTMTSTHCSLYHVEHGVTTVLGIVPPSLVTQWGCWLSKIKHVNGAGLDVLKYEGTPAKRRLMDINVGWLLMSIQIFKLDYERIVEDLAGERVHIFVDEAHCLKDVGTQNYKRVRDFSAEHSIQLLTGTPLNNPMDAYAYTKFTAPTIYRNLMTFEQIHVAKRDFFDKPIEYQNLDLLTSNLLINAVRHTKEQVLTELPECIITEIEYSLHKDHQRLYREIAEDQLLKLPDGDKLDFTHASALYHAMGQVVCQWHHFAQNPKLKSACYGLIEDILDELGSKKLIVFAHYTRTNQEMVRRFNCPGIWGEITKSKREKALRQFIDDDKCRLITLQPKSAGEGTDGLQHVCTDVLYIEQPGSVTQLTQSLSRVHRNGQKEVCNIRLGSALQTLQPMRWAQLTAKEALVNPLQLSRAMLRDALLGNMPRANSDQRRSTGQLLTV